MSKDATFVGYVNGDIVLHAPTVLSTLAALGGAVADHAVMPPTLFIVGSRRNLDLTRARLKLTASSAVQEAVRLGRAAPVGSPLAQDYFFTTLGAIAWRSEIPQSFVVGRRGYDNWLVCTC